MKTKITLFAFSALVITASNQAHFNQVLNLQRGPASEEKIEPVKDEKSEIANLLCLAKNEAAKLSEEVKKLLKDKEEVVAEVNKLKKENEDMKNKSSEDKIKKPASSEDFISMMSQMTNLMLSQQQLQMQMQNQMFSMMNSMNNNSSMNMFNQYNPFNLDFNYGFNTGIYSSPYPKMNSMDSLMGYYGNSIGLGSSFSGIGNYYGYPNSTAIGQVAQVYQVPEQNRAPAAQYSMLPEQSLQQPQIRGFDLSNGPSVMKQPDLIQMQKQQML